MGDLVQGAGGGRAVDITEGDDFSLDKPYDSTDPNLDEMLRMLFGANKNSRSKITTLTTRINRAMSGPASSVIHHLAGFADTTGAVLEDVGYAVTDIALTSNVMLKATLTLNTAQLTALDATPSQVVAAPGAGLALVPVQWTIRVTKAAATWTNNSSFQLRWAGIASNALNVLASGLSSGSAGSNFNIANSAGVLFGIGGSDPANQALQVSFDLNATPNVGGSASAFITVVYYIAPVA